MSLSDPPNAFSAAAIGLTVSPSLKKKKEKKKRYTEETRYTLPDKNSRILNFRAKDNLHPALVSHLSHQRVHYTAKKHRNYKNCYATKCMIKLEEEGKKKKLIVFVMAQK